MSRSGLTLAHPDYSAPGGERLGSATASGTGTGTGTQTGTRTRTGARSDRDGTAPSGRLAHDGDFGAVGDAGHGRDTRRQGRGDLQSWPPLERCHHTALLAGDHLDDRLAVGLLQVKGV